MSTHGYVKNKPRLQNRLKRVEGQVRGIGRMVEQDTYCIDILTQIGAARAALDKVALALLKDHAEHCLRENDGATRHKRASELSAAVARLLKA